MKTKIELENKDFVTGNDFINYIGLSNGDWFFFERDIQSVEMVIIKTPGGYMYLSNGDFYDDCGMIHYNVKRIKKITKLEWEV